MTWTHAICEICYELYWEKNGWPEEPSRVVWAAFDNPEVFPPQTLADGCIDPGNTVYDWCCFCRDGIEDVWGTPGVIYVRYDPAKLRCADLHKAQEEE